MWVTYTFLLTYIIILGAHAARSDTETAPRRPQTLTLPCSPVLPELVLVPVLASARQSPPCKWGLPHQPRFSFPWCEEVKPRDANALAACRRSPWPSLAACSDTANLYPTLEYQRLFIMN